jgi:hypothetical protein
MPFCRLARPAPRAPSRRASAAWAPRAAGFFALLSSCQELEYIAPRLCGNLVVEAGEECDSTDETLCHSPISQGPKYACRRVCGPEQPCPEGYGCSTDAVCNQASGRFSAGLELEGTASVVGLEVADLDGDRQDELIMGSFGRQSIASFDGRTPIVTDAPLGDETLVIGDLNCDTRQDVVAFSSPFDREFNGLPSAALKVLLADESGALVPSSQFTAPPVGRSRRLLSADSDGDGRAEPLLLVDDQLYAIPIDGSAQFRQLLAMGVTADALPGNIPSADWDPASPCHEIALAARGARTVVVRSLCGPESAAPIAVVELPASATGSVEGAFSGEVDGDGRVDLIITAGDGSELGTPLLYVAYGVGDGSFDDTPRPPAGERGNDRASEPLLSASSDLLAVAELDGDGRADFVLADSIVFSSRRQPDCRPNAVGCEVSHAGSWVAAAVSDFNRDGQRDLMAAEFEARELTFMLGLGAGAFNTFALSTEGTVAFLPAVPLGSPRPTEPTAALAAGDFNGDLTDDIAFIERLGRTPGEVALSIVLGTPLGIPGAPRHVSNASEIIALAAGTLFRGPNTSSDLVMLARTGAAVGIGLFAGQTNSERPLFSALPLPLDPTTREPLELVDVALGRFRSDASVGSTCGDVLQPRPPEDMVLLTRNQAGGHWLFFVNNTEYGFDSASTMDPRLMVPVPPAAAELALVEIDLDADGTDEVLVYPSRIGPGTFTYQVARRAEPGVELQQFTTPLRGLPEREINVERPRRLRDIDGDGRVDFTLNTPPGYFAEEVAENVLEAYALVFLSTGSEQLGAGTALLVPGSNDDIFAAPDTYLNADADRELELAVLSGHGIVLFNVPREPGPLQPLLTLASDQEWWDVAAGDFDGDGIEDLAAVAAVHDGALRVFWGEPVRP